jgi:hypothetical protein
VAFFVYPVFALLMVAKLGKFFCYAKVLGVFFRKCVFFWLNWDLGDLWDLHDARLCGYAAGIISIK